MAGLLSQQGLALAACAAASASTMLVPSALAQQPAVPSGKMNVLFIAVDDLKPVLGCYGDSMAITPNIDRLAKRGTVFMNAHCQQAVCGASRASLMSGLRQDTTGITEFGHGMRTFVPGVITLPQQLSNHGYQTTGMGKIYDNRNTNSQDDSESWSIPYIRVHNPTDRTFTYISPELVPLIEARKAEAKAQGITDQRLIMKTVCPPYESADVPDNAHYDGMIAERGVETLKDLSTNNQPFFLGVGFYKPHLPFNAPKRYWDMYDPAKIKPVEYAQMPVGAPAFHFQDSGELRARFKVPPGGTPIPEEMRIQMTHGYYACVSYIDAQVGMLLDTLAETGLEKNTIIVLFGDHGFHLGDHGMWCKHTNYEQATRSPLIIAGPPGLFPAQSTQAPVELMDIYPTLCDILEVPAPHWLEGKSLKPLLYDPEADVKPYAMSMYPRNPKEHGKLMGYALRDRRYRYIEWRKEDSHGNHGRGEVVARELYDLATDPHETVNLVDLQEHAETLQRFLGYVSQADLGRRSLPEYLK